MDRIFDPDGKIMELLWKPIHIMFLNLLWVLFSLPIVTIPAAMIAQRSGGISEIAGIDNFFSVRTLFKLFADITFADNEFVIVKDPFDLSIGTYNVYFTHRTG